jgi:hypothetical protein
MKVAMKKLHRLAELIKQRNTVEVEMTAFTGRPATLGHLGEYIAGNVFGIDLLKSAAHKGIDGHFATGPLSGYSVNIKWYAAHQNLLDITPLALPDFYLVMTGSKSESMSSRGRSQPWAIEHVYLFQADALVEQLQKYRVKIGTATSIREHLWLEAEIYPAQRSGRLILTDEQCHKLALFRLDYTSPSKKG